LLLLFTMEKQVLESLVLIIGVPFTALAIIVMCVYLGSWLADRLEK
jgi:hypothetical protein